MENVNFYLVLGLFLSCGGFLGAVVGLLYYKGLAEKIYLRHGTHDKLNLSGTLLSGLAHDLNNALFVINGTTETLLEKKPSPEKAAESLCAIQKQSQKVSATLSRISHFSLKRFDAKPQITTLDIHSPVKNIVLFLKHDLAGQHLKFTKSVPNDFPKILADQAYLETAWMLLIKVVCAELLRTGKTTVSLDAHFSSGRKHEALILISGESLSLTSLSKRKANYYQYLSAKELISEMGARLEKKENGFLIRLKTVRDI